MCGLVGVFGNLFGGTDEGAFRNLLIASSLRGSHSTGIGWSDGSDAKGKYIKVDGNPYDLIQTKEGNEFFKDFQRNSVVIGHNRWATRGEVNSKNAHPFAHEHILLAHNGSIHNQKKITKREFAVDSEAIAFAFSERDEREVIGEIDGAFCLTWYNSKTKKFNIIRNDERPMFYVKNKYRNTWYYASEEMMLDWVLDRNNIQVDVVQKLKVGTMLSWSKDAADKLELQEVALRKNFPHPNQAGHWKGHHYDDDTNYEHYWKRRDNYPYWASAASKSSVGGTVAPVTETAKTPEKETSKVSQIGTVARNPALRDYKKGCDWLKSNGVVAGMRLTPWFYDCTFYHPENKGYSGYAMGRLIGGFVLQGSYTNDIVQVVVEGVCPMDYANKDDVIGTRLDVKVLGCYQELGGKYIITAEKPERMTDKMEIKEMAPRIKQVALVHVPTKMEKLLNRTAFCKEPSNKAVVQFPEHGKVLDYVRGPSNTYIPMEQWVKITRDGCSHCYDDLLPSQANEIDWLSPSDPLCPECLKEFVETPEAEFKLGFPKKYHVNPSATMNDMIPGY